MIVSAFIDILVHPLDLKEGKTTLIQEDTLRVNTCIRIHNKFTPPTLNKYKTFTFYVFVTTVQ